MFLLICKLYICIQNVFGHIFYRSRLHLYWQFWQFEVQKLAYMLILAAGGSSPYLSSVPPPPPHPPFFDLSRSLEVVWMSSESYLSSFVLLSFCLSVFYSTPSTEGVESTRGNSVCLCVCP